MDYFHLFGTKNCVFEDLKMFLNEFPADDVKEFLRRINEKVQAEPVDFDCPASKTKENVCVCVCVISTIVSLSCITSGCSSLFRYIE